MTGADAYPDVKGSLKTGKIHFLDTAGEAKKIGNERVESSILLGAFCSMHGFSEKEFKASLGKRVNKYINENIAAFVRGKELVK